MIASPGAKLLDLGDVEEPDDLLVGQVPEQRHVLQHLDLAGQLLGAVSSAAGAGRGLLVDADDDGGDVVVPAARVRQVDSRFGSALVTSSLAAGR